MTTTAGTEAPLTDVTRRVLELVEGHLAQLTSTPDQIVRHFASAGLARCCVFLRGIMTLASAGLTVLATGLARQHWETWVVSLHVLLGRDKALREVAGDDIYWKRTLAESLKLGVKYHVDWAGGTGKLNYRSIYDRVVAALEAAG